MPPDVDQSNALSRDVPRLGIVKTAVTQALVLLVLAGAVVWYVNWSSEAAVSEFMRAGKPPVSGLNLYPPSQAPVQTVKGKALCVPKA